MRYLHIIPNEKFTEPYIDFINGNFEANDHLFFLLGQGTGSPVTKRKNVIDFSHGLKNIGLYSLLVNLYKAEKIFIHGLFSMYLVSILFLQPWLLPQSYWCIWGGDLYYYKFRKKSLKHDVYEKIRKSVIANMGGLITHIRGDYELAKDWYGAKGKYYYCFMYPSNLYKDHDTANIVKNDEKRITIQIGNSADPTNNHLEVFYKLEKYKNANIEIICPLSYGDVKYRDCIINEGKKIFGEKFTPQTEFVTFDQYLNLLAQVDIAIFNHSRQQAMGNITTLVGLGKKVYIRDEVTSWHFFAEMECKLYLANSDYNNLFEIMSELDKNRNINIIKICFSEKKLICDLTAIFQ